MMREEEGLVEEQEAGNGVGNCEQDANRGDEGESKEAELKKKKKRKAEKRTLHFDDVSKRGVCHLSRFPPHMDPTILRRMLSQYGEVSRIYLSPKDPSAPKGPWKRPGSSRRHAFSEGWVEFAKKSVAKRVANMLNGEQIGGRRRSPFYYDIWNIKYLKKFTWDALSEENAKKKAFREQKLALEISAAKRERNYTLAKFGQAHALSSMQERLEKKRRIEDSEFSEGITVEREEVKIFRRFPQKKPIDNANQKAGTLSKDILEGVFGNS